MHQPVPPGQSPPFAVIDPDHRGGLVVIVGALGLVISFVCLLIRLYVRLVLCPPFACDDFFLLTATATAITQSGLVFGAVSRGFGTSFHLLGRGDLYVVETLMPIGNIFFLITVYLTKCCMLVTYLRLTDRKLHNRASRVTLVLCTSWVIISVLIVSVNCAFNRTWHGFGDTCPNLIWRWRYVAFGDLLTELILFILAVCLLNGFYMYLLRKVALWFAFFFRLPIIIFAILRVYSLRAVHEHHKISTLVPSQAINPTLWTQVELNYALIACSVFCLRPFMVAVHTNCGVASGSNLECTRQLNPSRSQSRTRSSVAPSPADLSGALQRIPRDDAGSQMEERKGSGCVPGVREGEGRGSNSMSIEVAPPPAAVVRGSGRGKSKKKDPGEMCIRKEVEYSVEYGKAQLSTKGVIGTQNWDLYFRGYGD